jgi:hypothetical protein
MSLQEMSVLEMSVLEMSLDKMSVHEPNKAENQISNIQVNPDKQSIKLQAAADKKAIKLQAAANKQAKIDAANIVHSDEYYELLPVSVLLDVTFTHTLINIGFDGLPPSAIQDIFKDGRVFAHFIEVWLASKYPITHISGCKSYDFTDTNYPETIYDEKTFTKNGCKFYPSNMIGEGRSFDKELFEKKAKKLIYCIVSNVNFPEIKIKFVRGIHLLKLYPKGEIPLKDYVKFFN